MTAHTATQPPTGIRLIHQPNRLSGPDAAPVLAVHNPAIATRAVTGYEEEGPMYVRSPEESWIVEAIPGEAEHFH